MFWGAFVFTCIIEWLLFSAFSRYALKLTFYFCLLINLVTWPVISWLYSTTAIPLWQLELGVWLVETGIIVIHWQWKLPQSAIAAFVINAASWGLGTLIETLYFS